MTTRKNFKKNIATGFTLLEILLVVGIISILAGITIIAINPGKQLADARNAQRRSDIRAISEAIYQYILNNPGTGIIDFTGESIISCEIDSTSAEICSVPNEGDGCYAEANDYSRLTDNALYLTTIPSDPTGAGQGDYEDNGTGYFASQEVAGRITVCAPYAENGAVISITR